MLAGHADEIAMAVNFINPEGFIYVRKLGGVDPAITKAQRVVIQTRNGPVRGVVGNVAPHLMKDEGEKKPPKIHDLFIDIGAPNREEARKLVRMTLLRALLTMAPLVGGGGSIHAIFQKDEATK